MTADLRTALPNFIRARLDDDDTPDNLRLGIGAVLDIHRPNVYETAREGESFGPDPEHVYRFSVWSCEGCNASYEEEPYTPDINGCETLCALAGIWRSHPDWRDDWTTVPHRTPPGRDS